jgi:hypothetical protein
VSAERKPPFIKRRPPYLQGVWTDDFEHTFGIDSSTWNHGEDAIGVMTGVRDGVPYVLIDFAGEQVGAPKEAARLALRPNQYAWLMAALQEAPGAYARWLDEPQDDREYPADDSSEAP